MTAEEKDLKPVMQEQEIGRLREALEQAVGRKLQTPKDFKYLSDCIFDKLHEHISPTTFKRMWGYLTDAGAVPRKSTLDILSRFLDYPDWAAFCANANSEVPTNASDEATSDASVPADSGAEPQSSSSSTGKSPFRSMRNLGWVFAILLLLVIIPLAIHSLRAPAPNILRQGRAFTCYDDYLQLFGLKSDANNTYFIRIPSQPYVALWAPKYHHRVWHNDGDPKRLMPTITEYYHPEDYPTDSASLAELARVNKEGYIRALRSGDVRLTFMKDLLDSTYIFLGVYRISSTLSDSTHVVWCRVATDVDLDHLELLDKFRW